MSIYSDYLSPGIPCLRWGVYALETSVEVELVGRGFKPESALMGPGCSSYLPVALGRSLPLLKASVSFVKCKC